MQKNHSEVVPRKHRMGWYCFQWAAKGMNKMGNQNINSKRNSISKMHQAGWFWESSRNHHFLDASQDVYGQVSYLKLVSYQGVIYCILLTWKARVNPLRYVSIPRLEVLASTASVKTALLLREELDIEINKEYFWIYSKVVLGYISDSSKRVETSVGNRI